MHDPIHLANQETNQAYCPWPVASRDPPWKRHIDWEISLSPTPTVSQIAPQDALTGSLNCRKPSHDLTKRMTCFQYAEWSSGAVKMLRFLQFQCVCMWVGQSWPSFRAEKGCLPMNIHASRWRTREPKTCQTPPRKITKNEKQLPPRWPQREHWHRALLWTSEMACPVRTTHSYWTTSARAWIVVHHCGDRTHTLSSGLRWQRKAKLDSSYLGIFHSL